MNKGVFLDFATISPRDLDLCALKESVSEWTFFDTTELAEIEARVEDAEVLVTNKVPIDEYTLQKTPKLKLIVVAATGYEHIDLEACRRQGIRVCNVKNYSTASVVQHTFALIFALNTGLIKYHQRVVRGAWQNSLLFCLTDFPIHDVEGKTLGVIGYGSIGRAIATAASSFGMEVIVAQRSGTSGASDSKVTRLDLSTLLERSDIVSLHCPKTSETLNIIDAHALSLMKKDALLINTARGGLINERDLAQALKERSIGGAGIDVLSTEPPEENNPLLAEPLPNLIITPHIAWASNSSRQRLVNRIAEIIKNFSSLDDLDFIV